MSLVPFPPLKVKGLPTTLPKELPLQIQNVGGYPEYGWRFYGCHSERSEESRGSGEVLRLAG